MGDALRVDYYISPEAYLEAERTRKHKHEYLAGVEYQMAGASAGHNRIVVNLLTGMGSQHVGKRCEVFASDLKVRIRTNTAEFYYYPDVTVACSGVANPTLFEEQPRVIFEVPSAETGRIDRGEKMRNYQALPSLDAYGSWISSASRSLAEVEAGNAERSKRGVLFSDYLIGAWCYRLRPTGNGTSEV